MQTFRRLLLVAPIALLPASCQTTPPAAPDRFAVADANQDGLLNGAEVNGYFVSNIFTERDTNGDGFITKVEWNPAMPASEAKLFAARDTNQDGQVSLAEAEVHALKAGTYTGMFSEADTNKDNSITREEAKAYYASKEGPVR